MHASVMKHRLGIYQPSPPQSLPGFRSVSLAHGLEICTESPSYTNTIVLQLFFPYHCLEVNVLRPIKTDKQGGLRRRVSSYRSVRTGNRCLPGNPGVQQRRFFAGKHSTTCSTASHPYCESRTSSRMLL